MMAKKDMEPEDPKPGVATAGTPAADADSSATAEDVSPAEQVKKLLAEKQDLMNTLVRRQADFENYRKRVEKERHQERRTETVSDRKRTGARAEAELTDGAVVQQIAVHAREAGIVRHDDQRALPTRRGPIRGAPNRLDEQIRRHITRRLSSPLDQPVTINVAVADR